jgi:branched-chain amino acid transport system ATP-binding protein
MSVLLQVTDVSMVFGGLTALSKFNLAIHSGDLQGLIGPNGAGKTTAFNAVTGVYQPSAGEVLVDGVKVNGLRPSQVNRLGLARTFQNIRLFKNMSAIDNVKTVLAEAAKAGTRALDTGVAAAFANYRDWWRALLVTPAFVRQESALETSARAFLETMGLGHRADELAKNLPYGEQRRLEIARALATGPKVLLLDEPAAGMNTREKADLMVLIRQIRDEFKLGVLLIEHDMKLVMGICEKLTVLDHGETISVGEPKAVREDKAVIEAYLGEAPAHA